MLVTVSNDRLNDLVRESEGQNISDDEIAFRPTYYFDDRLLANLKNFGVEREMGILNANPTGSIGTIRFNLKPAPFDPEERLTGIQRLRPLFVTVESQDLPALVGNRVTLNLLESHWAEVVGTLHQISVGEVRDRLERAAGKLMNQRTQINNELDMVRHQNGYQEWLAQNGLTDPLAKREAAEKAQYEQAEADQKAQLERFYGQ